MNQAVLNSMTAAEQRLVADGRDALAGLDEEKLLALHSRIRRARAKYVTTYRRSAAGAVVKRGGRGFSHPKNQRDRDKAEVFESALAAVSKEGGPLRTAARTGAWAPAVSRPRGARKKSGGLKKDASSRAAGARRQAKRDAR